MNLAEISFERLLSPIGPQRFLAEYFERKPLLLSRGDRGYYRSLFSLSSVDAYLHAARGTARRVSVVPPPGSGRSTRRMLARDAPLGELYRAFQSGETIRLEGVHEVWPSVAALVAEIGGAMGVSASVNAYLTPADSQGLKIHYDTHDVFVVQVDGSKDWCWYENSVELPIERQSYLMHIGLHTGGEVQEEAERLLGTTRLEAGDLLYLPRGYPHKARTADEPSLHLAVAVDALFWVDLLKAAVEQAAIHEPELRRTLPVNAAGTPQRQQLAARFRALLESAAGQACFERALGVLMTGASNRAGFPPDGHFAELARVDRLTLNDRVERRAGVECRVFEGQGKAMIEFAGNRVQGPAMIGAALAHIRDHRAMRVAELPGALSDHAKLVLVRRLIREGLLRCRDAAAVPVEATSYQAGPG